MPGQPPVFKFRNRDITSYILHRLLKSCYIPAHGKLRCFFLGGWTILTFRTVGVVRARAFYEVVSAHFVILPIMHFTIEYNNLTKTFNFGQLKNDIATSFYNDPFN